MQDIYTMLSTLRRPRLLISAARHGLAQYDRNRALGRLLPHAALPSPGPAALKLMELEAMHDSARREHSGSYSVARHVEVLIALMGEARLLQDRAQAL
ncbi:MAG: DUF6477 family protein [Pseudomonadota bacterium]